MKKYFKLGVSTLLVILVLTCIGCGSKKEVVTTMDTNTEATTTTEKSTLTKDGRYTSVDAYLNSELVQKELQQTLDSANGSSLFNIKVTAEGNKLIYTYTYKTLEKMDGMEETLNDGLEDQKNTFITIAKVLKEQVAVDSPCVVIRYVDCNNVVIAERTFTVNG